MATQGATEPTTTQPDNHAGVSSGKLRYLTAGDIKVDTRYQRGLNLAQVERIASQFDPGAFGTITVSRRNDGSLWVLDGQHRLAALQHMNWGDQRVPCIVYDGLSLDDEAKLFYSPQMTRRALTPMERFRARLILGDPVAIEIKRIANAHGYEINTGTGSDGNTDTIDAVAAVECIYKTWAGGAMLGTVLGVTRDAWGTNEFHIPGSVLIGIAAFCYRFPEYNRTRLISVLRSIRPESTGCTTTNSKRVASRSGRLVEERSARMGDSDEKTKIDIAAYVDAMTTTAMLLIDNNYTNVDSVAFETGSKRTLSLRDLVQNCILVQVAQGAVRDMQEAIDLVGIKQARADWVSPYTDAAGASEDDGNGE